MTPGSKFMESLALLTGLSAEELRAEAAIMKSQGKTQYAWFGWLVEQAEKNGHTLEDILELNYILHTGKKPDADDVRLSAVEMRRLIDEAKAA